MSDYLFSSTPNATSKLTSSIKQIYQAAEVECLQFTGEWGSLAVTPSPYYGLQPLETETHICVILGGPVFYFRDNSFLMGSDPHEGTRALLKRFLQGKLDLVEDISGPFQLVVVNKLTNEVSCFTDLMLFIPAYMYRDNGNGITFGSHVDAVARIAKKSDEYDRVSIADFILHGVVTYPFTIFADVKQMGPAAGYRFKFERNRLVYESEDEPYWMPHEEYSFGSIDDVAGQLREGVKHHVAAITKSMSHVAQFVSGGEDSRVLLGLMPERLQKDGYVFLDSVNREGKIAQRVAKAYSASLKIGLRYPLHYLNIVDEACALVGSGHQYVHCHSLRFDKEFELKKYPAVFGGYFSDSLLKGAYARKSMVGSKFRVIPERWLEGSTQGLPVLSSLFGKDLLQQITRRRVEHVNRVKEIRPETVHEWFVLWPATMRKAITNHYCNRRLFPSYEVFMSHEVVKISSSVPTSWKLNRRLFHKAFQPCLEKTKWIRHGDGRLPYFGWFANGVLELGTKSFRKLNSRKERLEGPWPQFSKIIESNEFKPIRSQMEDAGRNLLGARFRISEISNPRNVLSLAFLVRREAEVAICEPTMPLEEGGAGLI